MMEDGQVRLKEKAQHREEWSRWTFGPDYWFAAGLLKT